MARRKSGKSFPSISPPIFISSLLTTIIEEEVGFLLDAFWDPKARISEKYKHFCSHSYIGKDGRWCIYCILGLLFGAAGLHKKMVFILSFHSSSFVHIIYTF
jgi:hypothetical protein